MKLTQKTFPGSAARAAKECRIFYFCGPDEAGASDAANRIAAMLGEAEKVELTRRGTAARSREACG